ncbi:MAG: hypothetical protein ACJZ12_05060 [Candidatus Neomarinimicrobiota bacterium]
MKNSIVLIPLSLFIVVSCVENTSIDEQNHNESILLELIENDEVAGLGGFDSGGEMDLDHEIGLETGGIARIFSDTLTFGQGYRIRFGRNLIDRERSVDFEIGEDTAIGLVAHQVNGEFLVTVIDTNQNQIDSLSFTKEFSTTLTRKIRFIKVDDASEVDGYRWKINALTPMVGGSGDKVIMNELSLHAIDDSLHLGDLLYSFVADDLGNLFINRDSLPVFTAFSKIVAYVYVDNTGPEYVSDSSGVGEWVFLNYGRDRQHRGRRHLHDSGIALDEVMNDNIHTRAIRIHGPGSGELRGVFRTFIESIDLATMFVSDGGYNTSIWSIPYRVERP